MTEHLNRALLTLKPSGIRAFNQLADQTPDCIRFTLGEPDFSITDQVKGFVTGVVSNGDTHYSPAAGIQELRAAISEFESNDHGLQYAADEILVTDGATEALYLALMGILNPGDEVIIPIPAFSLYESIVRMADAVPVFLDTSSDGYQITAASLASVMTEKTKAIVLNSPNNPTGTVYNTDSLETVRSAVAGKPVFVICDDVYNRIVFNETCPMFAAFSDLRDQLMVVQSFSKTFAMTGFRVGYLMAPAEIITALTRLHSMTVRCSASFTQRPSVQALKGDYKQMVDIYRARRELVCRRLKEMGMDYIEPSGGFYVFPSIAKYGMSSDEFCTRMIKEAAVAAVPGSVFGSDDHIRISYCCSDEQLSAGLDRMENFLNSL